MLRIDMSKVKMVQRCVISVKTCTLPRLIDDTIL